MFITSFISSPSSFSSSYTLSSLRICNGDSHRTFTLTSPYDNVGIIYHIRCELSAPDLKMDLGSFLRKASTMSSLSSAMRQSTTLLSTRSTTYRSSFSMDRGGYPGSGPRGTCLQPYASLRQYARSAHQSHTWSSPVQKRYSTRGPIVPKSNSFHKAMRTTRQTTLIAYRRLQWYYILMRYCRIAIDLWDWDRVHDDYEDEDVRIQSMRRLICGWFVQTFIFQGIPVMLGTILLLEARLRCRQQWPHWFGKGVDGWPAWPSLRQGDVVCVSI